MTSLHAATTPRSSSVSPWKRIFSTACAILDRDDSAASATRLLSESEHVQPFASAGQVAHADQFFLRKHAVDVEQESHLPVRLPDAQQARRVHGGAHRGRRIELRRLHVQHFGHLVDDDAELGAAGADDDDAGLDGAGAAFHAELQPQVDDRDDLPAQIDDAAHERGRPRHRRDGQEPDDLLHFQDADAVLLGFEEERQVLAGDRREVGHRSGRG
jgi:hypothetical protein